MSEDEARLQAHLDDVPGDRTVRLVLADLLEEFGDEEAARVQRWLAASAKWPDNDLAFCRKQGWRWWSNVDHPSRKRAHAVLPHSVQTRMPRCEWIYSTRQEAEEALREALAEAHLV